MNSRLILITGMSSSGKTTLARLLERELRASGVFAVHLDGIEFRRMISILDFSKGSVEDVSNFILNFTKVMAEKGLTLVYSLIAHKRAFREALKGIVPTFHVHLDCPIDVLRKRDEKGVYKMADRGEMFLPGYSEPYEEPLAEDLRLFCDSKENLEKLLKALEGWRWM